MPRLQDIQITKAWRHESQPGRIHYIILREDGRPRRLWTEEGSELGLVLNEALVAQGYEGPLRKRTVDGIVGGMRENPRSLQEPRH